MKYIKLFEEHNQFNPSLLFNLLDKLDSRGIIDKITQGISKTPGYEPYMKFRKKEINGNWELIIYDDDNFESISTLVYLKELKPSALENVYNTILGLVNVGNIIKQINEDIGDEEDYTDPVDIEKRECIDKLNNILNDLDRMDILDKVMKKVFSDVIEEQPEIVNYIRSIKYLKTENGTWIKIFYPSIGLSPKSCPIEMMSIDSIKTSYDEIIKQSHIDKVMKQINERNEEEHKFDPNTLFDLLDTLSDRNILDKVVQKLSNIPDYIKHFNFVKIDSKWRIEMYDGGTPPKVGMVIHLDTMNSRDLEYTYNQILSLVNIGDIMKKINK